MENRWAGQCDYSMDKFVSNFKASHVHSMKTGTVKIALLCFEKRKIKLVLFSVSVIRVPF